ncbi:siroheme synthase CysG [Kiloniella laminariae]|uniref:Siroheme synthase n=1 Tax=Kiloniella laminariae TaxID=454162 RepID=A0ABT4LLC7_9PROT|nr:siroheme synthase CysG [Kiloniella laminariae]MCZ4281917.1 siroheme synthase CysG [Kiloniella laminariae]
MDHFPIFLSLKGQRVILVGGGELATRKLRLLRKAEAAVTVIAPSACTEILELVEQGVVGYQERKFKDEDLNGASLVFAATDIEEVDTAVSQAARQRGVKVNAVDRPELSDFIMPAIVDRSPIVIGISSGGSAPILARNLREKIEGLLPPALGRLASFADSFRGAVKGTITSGGDRRRFWENFFDGPVAESVLAGREVFARERMLGLINLNWKEKNAAGHVAIVGAGPGDPDLLTFRAMRFMQQADVVVYDRLISDEILDYVRRDADRIYVGKGPGNHSKTQDEINDILVQEASKGLRVVRLKGGDPFVFGRGGEEMEVLQAAGIEVDIVPGITAAIGCAAAAAVPLTHRDHASMVTFVAGQNGDGIAEADWSGLANSRQTLVFYMGVSKANNISAKLMLNGLSGETPVAIIENGTRPDQRVLPGKLSGLGELTENSAITGPALIVIGSVAAFARQQDLRQFATEYLENNKASSSEREVAVARL